MLTTFFLGHEDRSDCGLTIRPVQDLGTTSTRYRAEEAVWIERLRRMGRIDVVMPSMEDRDHLVRIMDTELVHGYAEESARVDLLRIVKGLKRQRAGAMILTAPELALLWDPPHPDFRIVDATRVQVSAAVRWALGLTRSDLHSPPCASAHESPS